MEQTVSSKSTFTQWQLTVLVLMAGMGGMYFYPRHFSRSSLASLAVCVGLTLVSMLMLSRCFASAQGISFPGLLRELLGGAAARIILAAAAIYFAAEICCVVLRQTQMTGQFLLEKTPPQVVLGVTLTVVCFIITSGIRQVARTAELLFPVVMLPLAFIMAMGIYCMDYGELAPLMAKSSFAIGDIPDSASQLGGIAAAAYFAGYYDKKKLGRSLLGGSSVLAVFCVLILLCCVGVFSVEGTRHLAFPLTELSRTVSVGSVSLNHRFDILYIMIYTSVTVIAAGILLYCCCISLCGIFGVKSHSCFNFLLLPILFTASYFSLSDDRVISYISSFGKTVFLFGLIPALFLISEVKRHRKVKI